MGGGAARSLPENLSFCRGLRGNPRKRRGAWGGAEPPPALCAPPHPSAPALQHSPGMWRPQDAAGALPCPPSLLPLPTPGMGPCCTAPTSSREDKTESWAWVPGLSPRLSWRAGGPGPGPSERGALRARQPSGETGSGPEGRQAQGAALLTAQRLHWNSGHTGAAIAHSARRRF